MRCARAIPIVRGFIACDLAGDRARALALDR
jgi:hypothetical protein